MLIVCDRLHHNISSRGSILIVCLLDVHIQKLIELAFIYSMFVTSCKRLRIMKGTEARGLGCGVWETTEFFLWLWYDEWGLYARKRVLELMDFESRYLTTMPILIWKGDERFFLHKLCQHVFGYFSILKWCYMLYCLLFPLNIFNNIFRNLHQSNFVYL